MKLIRLTQDKFVKVDDEDYDSLIKHNWFAKKCNNSYYVCRNTLQKDSINGKRTVIMLHREIINAPVGMDVDHIDMDTLNCQKNNLRICSRSQNCMNKKKRADAKDSIYKGVSLHKSRNKKTNQEFVYWQSRICVNNKRIRLGLFTFTTDGEKQAAEAYNKAAKKHFKEFANLNII